MIGLLPTSLEVGGRKHKIRTDYRVILELFQAFNDETLTDSDKVFICLNGLYVNPDDIPSECLEEALQKANWFLDGGDIPKSKATPDRTFDWKHDEYMIFSAVNKTAGCEVRALKYLHWWSFLGYFSESGESLLSTVLSIRIKKMKGKQLDKSEREFYNEHKNLINILSEQDKKDLKETEDFVNQLFTPK